MTSLQTPSKRRFALECVALVVIATVLRVWYIGKTDLGYDEGFTLHASLQTLHDLVNLLIKGDNPPLWEILMHFWIKVFGISEVAIRSLSLIFSVLTVVPIYMLGEKHLHRFVGIAAALMYACSTFSIYMAHECRVYSLIGFLTACSAFLFINIIEKPKTIKFILLTLVNLMLMYGHYLSVWVIIMEFTIALIIKPIRKKIWKPYLIHAAALILLFIPMFPVLFRRFMDSGLNGTWIEKTTSPEALYDFLWRMCNVPVTTVLAIAILISALIKLIAAAFQKKYHYDHLDTLSLFWVVPLLVSFILSYFTGFFLDRYFYFIFPLFYLSLASYCIFLFPKRKVIGLTLMGICTTAMAIACSPDSSTKRFSGWHPNIKPIVHQLIEAKESEKTLVILPEHFEKQFTYYLDEKHEIFRTQSRPTNYYVFWDYILDQGYFYDSNYQNADLDTYNKVAFPYHKTMPINGLTEYLESAGFHLEKKQDEHPFEVSYFTR